MIDGKYRKFYQEKCLDPLLRFPFFKKLKPSWATAIACISGISVCPSLIFSKPYLAIFCLLVSGFFDTLDGAIARKYKTASPRGAVLDITSDRLVETAIVIGLFAVNPETRALPSLLMLGSILLCVTTFLVVGIFAENKGEKGFYYSAGLMERAEAFLFFIAMILAPHYFIPLAYVFCALVLFTAFWRLRETWR